MKIKAVIVAGGTGGHINAALSLGECLSVEKYDVLFITGTRHLDYALFKNTNCIHLNTMPLRYKNPLKILKSLVFNLAVFFNLIINFIKQRPAFVIGCGGYVCGPTLMAAYLLRIPFYIVEQNAVMGLTNKLLSYTANKIFLHFKNTKGLKPFMKGKIIISGNPTRQSIKYSTEKKGKTYNVLVFGGSLGALQVNRIIGELIKSDSDVSLHIIHQVGKGNKFEQRVGKNIKYEQHEYLDNMQDYYDWCNLIVSRAGASTISELRIVQRASILIPFPHATDNHQYYNALNLKEEVAFPVYLLGQEDSIETNCSKLKNIIIDLVNDHSPVSNGQTLFIHDSAKVIIDEIKIDIA